MLNLRGGTMATRKPTKKAVKKQSTNASKDLWADKRVRMAAAVVAAIFAICIVLFISRSWVRVTLVPKTVGIFHEDDVAKKAVDELASLGSPLTALGYTVTDTNVTKGCNLSAARGFKEQVTCSYSIHADLLVPTDETGKKQLVDAASSIQNKLQTSGWDGTFTNDNDYASLNELIGNVAKGIDYTPDAYYSKSIGRVNCTFDTNTAFSVPAPAMISTNFNCIQTIGIFTSGSDIIQVPLQKLPATMPADDKGVTQGL